MIVERHRHLAEGIHRSLAKLHPDDTELRIEAAMLAGTHWLNIALHAHPVTSGHDDVVHCSMVLVSQLRLYSALEPDLVDALVEIEDMRPVFVRGDVTGAADAADRAVALLEDMAQRVRATLPATPPSPALAAPAADRL